MANPHFRQLLKMLFSKSFNQLDEIRNNLVECGRPKDVKILDYVISHKVK